MPVLFSPTIGCAPKARHWFLTFGLIIANFYQAYTASVGRTSRLIASVL